ncbi:MAG TPA: ABC transporter permease [Chthoniobacteraceae bacterium]|nr:ABC transporter permease [Chthoniobacteraceae bacterium]
MSALRGLLRKEVFHVFRDRRTLAVVILMPILQVILFGYAIRTDINNIRVAVVDPRPDYATLELRNRLTATGLFEVKRVLQNTRDLDRLFQAGEIHEAIVFESGFADRLGRGMPGRVQVITDATDPNSGNAMQGYTVLVIQGYERELRMGTAGAGGMSSTAGPQNPSVNIVPEYQMRFNPTRESSNLFVPGVMAFVLTIISCLMTAISLTREKETGTMEALLVSPLRPWEIIVGKVAPYLIIGFISLIAVMLEAYFIFNVPFRGSVLLLMAEGMLFILTSLSLGILISASTSSQRVAMTGALAGTMLPTIVLSGFIFPLESLPRVLQWLANIVPAKWFVLISRGIMLKGVGLDYLWRETLILLAMALVLLALSARSFHVRLD